MSYVVRIWEQPAGLPLPQGFEEADRLLDSLDDAAAAPSAKLSLLAQRLALRFPSKTVDDCVWTDGPMPESVNGPDWNVGLVSSADLDKVQVVLVSEAVQLGLNVLDEQAGELHLGDGTVHSIGERGHCVRGMAAALARDFVTARSEFRRLAAQGNSAAHFRLGELYLNGHGVPKDPAVGCALICAGAGWAVNAQGLPVAPADSRASRVAARVRDLVGPEQLARADALLGKVRSDRGIVGVVDELMQVRAQVERQVRQGSAASTPPRTHRAPEQDEAAGAAPASKAVLLPLMLALGANGAMLARPSPSTFWVYWLAAALFGGYGVWQCAPGLGYAGSRRTFLTVGAMLPLSSIAVCGMALWRMLTGGGR